MGKVKTSVQMIADALTANGWSSFATPIGQQHRVGPMPSKAHMLHPLPFALAPPNPSFTRAQRNKTERTRALLLREVLLE
ncbi:hypothetical protein AB1Y20_006520 [Prymnesium parvum]|uniref:Uncharacterized protein n=1 Tax=Prymnesium parvum TaxID=97485 RepID=A0AB34J0V4_PRYPA